MVKIFFPNEYLESIFKINYENLRKKGIKGLIFDIDNTLVPYYIKEPTKEILKLFEDLIKKGFNIVLVSNNSKQRVVLFNQGLKFKTFHRAKKPRSINLKKAIEHMQLQNNQVALIGDQIFTDILGGNRTGIYTILVKPVSIRDEPITKIKRGVEKLVIKLYLKHFEDEK
ncbi:hypothetical protein AN642_02935 [Epulopiscium sp. SCG-B10WGA-EpuloA2]|nr:hypothetical protein AN642_02935 [Epulopiscium sp. SCG-B10WGA-EpuloA2]